MDINLQSAISAISEDRACAGWLDDIEHLVWEFLTNRVNAVVELRIGRDWNLTLLESDILNQLMKDEGGWVFWDDDVKDPLENPVKHISLEDWKVRHDAWRKRMLKR